MPLVRSQGGKTYQLAVLTRVLRINDMWHISKSHNGQFYVNEATLVPTINYTGSDKNRKRLSKAAQTATRTNAATAQRVSGR